MLNKTSEYEVIETIEFKFLIKANDSDDAISQGVLLDYSNAINAERIEMTAKEIKNA